jgi:uridine kinase
MNTHVIGLCGPSGCGKTTLATMLLSEFPGTLVSLDNYFILDPPYKKYLENGKIGNFQKMSTGRLVEPLFMI